MRPESEVTVAAWVTLCVVPRKGTGAEWRVSLSQRRKEENSPVGRGWRRDHAAHRSALLLPKSTSRQIQSKIRSIEPTDTALGGNK
jgi:hypothetical protein